MYVPWPVRRHELEGQVTDYKPDEWLYANDVNANDARELARALRTIAVPSGEQRTATLIVEGEGKVYDDTLGTAAMKLAEWCDGGAFMFAVDG